MPRWVMHRGGFRDELRWRDPPPSDPTTTPLHRPPTPSQGCSRRFRVAAFVALLITGSDSGILSPTISSPDACCRESVTTSDRKHLANHCVPHRVANCFANRHGD